MLWHFTLKWYVTKRIFLSLWKLSVEAERQDPGCLFLLSGIVMWDLTWEMRPRRGGQRVSTTEDPGAMQDFSLMIVIFWQK